jgi:hypothetical protein
MPNFGKTSRPVFGGSLRPIGMKWFMGRFLIPSGFLAGVTVGQEDGEAN